MRSKAAVSLVLTVLTGCGGFTYGGFQRQDSLSFPSYYEYPIRSEDSPIDFIIGVGFVKAVATSNTARQAARRALAVLEETTTKNGAEQGGAAAPTAIEGMFIADQRALALLRHELMVARLIQRQTEVAIQAGEQFAAGRSAEAVVRAKGLLEQMTIVELKHSQAQYSLTMAEVGNYLEVTAGNRAIPEEARRGAQRILEESVECLREIGEALAKRGVFGN